MSLDRRPSVTGHWPPIPTDAELSVAGLSADGKTVTGWIRLPSPLWTPDQDVLYVPPGAKALDYDKAADVDVFVPMGERAWIRAQLDKRSRYLEFVKRRIVEGGYQLTAAMRKILGIEDDDHVGLLSRLVTKSVSVEEATAALDSRHRYGLCSCHSETGLPIV